MNKIIFLFLVATALPICAMEEAAQASTQQTTQEPYAVIKLYQSKDWIPKYREGRKDFNSLRTLLNGLDIAGSIARSTAAYNHQQENNLIATLSDRIAEWIQSTKEVQTSSIILKNKWTNDKGKTVKAQVVLIKHPRMVYSIKQPDLPLDARKYPFTLLEKEWRANLALALLRESHLQPSYWQPKDIFEKLYSDPVEVFVSHTIEQ